MAENMMEFIPVLTNHDIEVINMAIGAHATWLLEFSQGRNRHEIMFMDRTDVLKALLLSNWAERSNREAAARIIKILKGKRHVTV